MTVDVEDGRAVAIGGDPDHRFTQGFLCAKVNHYLERVYSPDRMLHPMRRVGQQGRGPLRAHLLGRGARHDRGAPARRSPPRTGRRRSCPTPTPATWASSATAAWTGASSTRSGRASSTGRSARRRGRATASRPRSGRRWASTPRRSSHARLDRGLGREHRQLERAPLAVRRGGAAARRAARVRSTPTARAPRRSPTCHLAPLPGHRRRPRPRDDARRLPRRPRGPRLPRAHTVGAEELRERAREWTPARTAATTGLRRGGDRVRSPASTRRRGPRPSASTTA